MELGTRIRKIRLQQGRTLQEIADLSQCSKALVSKIETGKVVPALATLSKISKALGVKVSILMEDGAVDDVAYTPDLTTRPHLFTGTNKGYSIYPYAPQFLNKKMLPIMVRSVKDEVQPHSFSHDGEEFVFIVKGEAEVHIASRLYHLKEGESIYFESVNEHGILPLSEVLFYLDILYE